MKKTPYRYYLPLLGLIAIGFMPGCESTQGPVNAPKVSTLGPEPKEVIPAPQPKTAAYRGKEAFQAAEYDPGISANYPNARRVRLGVGEVVEVYRGRANPLDGETQMAFYLPPEAQSVVQLLTEVRGFDRYYFLRGVSRGETVGGVVERRWLDASGFRPRTPTDEGRIQAAVRGEPFLILVQ
jgi:hypothetical protein